MVKGEFIDGDKPMISATIAWETATQSPHFLLDTGFTGDIVVTPKIAEELGLEVSGVTFAKTATNKIESVQTATAIGVMEGVNMLVTVLISEGLPLLGISFLEKFKYKAIVDCKNKKVSLEVV